LHNPSRDAEPVDPTPSGPIKAAAREAGFDAVGIAAAEPDPYPGSLRKWLASGRHAGMAWMERTAGQRVGAAAFRPGTVSVVCVALNCYHTETPPCSVAMYARNADYHEILGEKLKRLAAVVQRILPDADVTACCDSSPVLERAYAERAGIGWIGRSGQLISRQFGTWLLLGELLVSRGIEPDPPHRFLCGRCNRCVRACPTGAIVGEFVLDSRRCLSYYTIEHRGAFPEWVQDRLGGRLFGCDDCISVCPFNRFARATADDRFRPGPHLQAVSRLPSMNQREFGEVFSKTPLARARLEGMKRNYQAVVAWRGSAERTAGTE